MTDAKETPNRRAFLRASAVALATPVALPVLNACGGGAGGGGTTAATVTMVDDIDVGGAVHLADQQVIVIRTDEGIAAISDVCTHRGCNVDVVDGQLECPCHGAVFDLMGNVLNPPAESPLPWHPVTVANGEITVDTSATVDQGTFTAL